MQTATTKDSIPQLSWNFEVPTGSTILFSSSIDELSSSYKKVPKPRISVKLWIKKSKAECYEKILADGLIKYQNMDIDIRKEWRLAAIYLHPDIVPSNHTI